MNHFQKSPSQWPAASVAIILAATTMRGTAADPLPFVPNDPYFFTDNVPGFPGEWQLDAQTSGAAVDANVSGAWARGLTGAGVVIGIVDGGVNFSNPDLTGNARPDLSWDFVTNAPASTIYNSHGTAVAGVAAAVGANGIGTTGAAPFAQIANIIPALFGGTPNLSGLTTWETGLANAILWHVDDIPIKNYSIAWGFGMANLTVGDDALRQSAGLGEINVFGAANWRGLPSEDLLTPDTNRHLYTHLPDVIVVAGLGSNGKFADYSNFGSSVTVTAPTLGSVNLPIGHGNFGITTTDQVGAGGYNSVLDSSDGDALPDLNYTSTFGGTSSSTPLVSGILALAKQVRPNLDTRFAKHLLALTSRVVDPNDNTQYGGWQTNAAGYHFNNNYGFGLIDADALTRAAVKYSGVTPLITHDSGTIVVNDSVAYSDIGGKSHSFMADFDDPLEEVVLTLSWTNLFGVSYYHGITNDIEASLVSPSGMTSLLLIPNDAEDDFPIDGRNGTYKPTSWSMTSNAFWGEDPDGLWTVNVTDTNPDEPLDFDSFGWDSYDLTFRSGSLIEAPEPTSLALFSLGSLIIASRRMDRGGR